MNDLRECRCNTTGPVPYECDRCADARLAMTAAHKPDLEQDEIAELPNFTNEAWQRRSQELNEKVKMAANELLENSGPVERVTIRLANGYRLTIKRGAEPVKGSH